MKLNYLSSSNQQESKKALFWVIEINGLKFEQKLTFVSLSLASAATFTIKSWNFQVQWSAKQNVCKKECLLFNFVYVLILNIFPFPAFSRQYFVFFGFQQINLSCFVDHRHCPMARRSCLSRLLLSPFLSTIVSESEWLLWAFRVHNCQSDFNLPRCSTSQFAYVDAVSVSRLSINPFSSTLDDLDLECRHCRHTSRVEKYHKIEKNHVFIICIES